MNIQLTSGTGSGPTPLAAFYAAIREAGVVHYNMIPLSSVIPPDSTIEEVVHYTPAPTMTEGDLIYVVLSEQRETEPGKEAWAGIGWSHDKFGGGWFVELHGGSEAQVKRDIYQTLEAMTADREREYGPFQHKVVGITCVDQPVCAVVIAVCGSQGWQVD